jgi:DNA-directed RNA polymerase specialized sigma24 family protein
MATERQIEQLLQTLEPIIVAKAKTSTIPGMDWEDVAQELRIKVVKEADRFLHGKANPVTFGNTVFRNFLINLHRDKSRPYRVFQSLEGMEEAEYQSVLSLDSDFEECSEWMREKNLSKCWDDEVLARMVEREGGV